MKLKPLILSMVTPLAAAQAPGSHPSVDPVLHGVVRWSPVSSTADAITGPIKTTPGAITLAGHTVPLSLAHALTGQQLRDAIALIPVTPAQNTAAAIYRVAVAGGTPMKRGNTLCGRSPVTWLVLISSTPDLALAAFSGSFEPDLATAGNSTALCGTLTYTSAPVR